MEDAAAVGVALEDIYSQLTGAVDEFNEARDFEAPGLFGLDPDDVNPFLRPLVEKVAELRGLLEGPVNRPIIDGGTFRDMAADIEEVEEEVVSLADAFEEELGEAQQAVSDLADELGDLLGILDTDIAKQNFARDLEDFLTSIATIVNQDVIDEGAGLADDIATQRGRIGELQAQVAEAQAEADETAAQIRGQIAKARREGCRTPPPSWRRS